VDSSQGARRIGFQGHRRLSLLAILAVVGTAACASAGGTASHAPSAPPSTTAAASTVSSTQQNPQVGKAYPFNLFIHCGVPLVNFGGRWWAPAPPVPNYPGPRPVNGISTYTGYVTGTMTLVTTNNLRFTADSRAVAAPFRVNFKPTKAPAEGKVCA
jgi:hypothetical protein